MGRLIACVLGLWLMTGAAFAQDGDAIEDVISRQLRAFSERDVQNAWRYASPNIQQMFGDAGNFGAMVQRGYPMVWDHAEVRFLELRDIDGLPWQKVMIRDDSGVLHVLDYQMIEGADGWQINQVQLLPAPDFGA